MQHKQKNKLTFNQHLDAAGWLKPSQKLRFILLSMIFVFLGILLSISMVSIVLNNNENIRLWDWIKCLSAVLLGVYLPYLWWKSSKTKYQRKLLREFVDVLTLLLVFLQYGLTVQQAMNQLVHLLGNYRYAFADQFKRTLFELSILPAREQAWINFSNRCNFQEIYYLTDFLKHENAYDKSLLESLERTRDFIQKRRFSNIEESAKKVSIYLSIPLVFFMLPALVLILLGPTIVQTVQRLY